MNSACFVNGQLIATRCLPQPQPVTALPEEEERTGLPPIRGGQQEITIFDGVTADIGDLVSIIIQGDGPAGVFVGRVAGVQGNAVLLCLTTAAGPIPAGAIAAIRMDAIAAAARIGDRV